MAIAFHRTVYFIALLDAQAKCLVEIDFQEHVRAAGADQPSGDREFPLGPQAVNVHFQFEVEIRLQSLVEPVRRAGDGPERRIRGNGRWSDLGWNRL